MVKRRFQQSIVCKSEDGSDYGTLSALVSGRLIAFVSQFTTGLLLLWYWKLQGAETTICGGYLAVVSLIVKPSGHPVAIWTSTLNVRSVDSSFCLMGVLRRTRNGLIPVQTAGRLTSILLGDCWLTKGLQVVRYGGDRAVPV